MLTKAVRLTAGLVLRNLIRTVPEARRLALTWCEKSAPISYIASFPGPTSRFAEWNGREGES